MGYGEGKRIIVIFYLFPNYPRLLSLLLDRLHLHDHMSPATAGGTHVKTARPVEDHLVRVSPVHEVLEKGIDHKDQIGQEEGADHL